VPVAIQQSPGVVCTILVQYSVFTAKNASDQLVGGEKSPSEDGLKSFHGNKKKLSGPRLKGGAKPVVT